MSLNANAIVTLAEAKEQMKVENSDTALDDTLETYINDASSAVESYTQRKIVVQSITNELHDGDGGNILYPKYFPIQQLSTESSPTDAQKLSALQYRFTPSDSWTNVSDDIDEVFIETGDNSWKPYIELWDDTFYAGRRNIKISYKAGYTTVPSDIKMVVLEMIQMRWNEAKRGNDWLGMGNVNQGQSGNNYSATLIELDKRWKRVLDRYRVPSLG